MSTYKMTRAMREWSSWKSGEVLELPSDLAAMVVGTIEYIDAEVPEFCTVFLEFPHRTTAYESFLWGGLPRHSFTTWLRVLYFDFDPDEGLFQQEAKLFKAGITYFHQIGISQAAACGRGWKVAREHLLDFVDTGCRGEY